MAPDSTKRSMLPVGTVLFWEGAPAVMRTARGWRFARAAPNGEMRLHRFLGMNDVDDLDTLPYTIQTDTALVSSSPSPTLNLEAADTRLTEILATVEAQVRAAPDDALPADLEAALRNQLKAGAARGRVAMLHSDDELQVLRYDGAAGGFSDFEELTIEQRPQGGAARRREMVKHDSSCEAGGPDWICVNAQVHLAPFAPPTRLHLYDAKTTSPRRGAASTPPRAPAPALSPAPQAKVRQAPPPVRDAQGRTAQDRTALDAAEARRARRRAKRLVEAAHGGIGWAR